jgi:hypothetical protein
MFGTLKKIDNTWGIVYSHERRYGFHPQHQMVEVDYRFIKLDIDYVLNNENSLIEGEEIVFSIQSDSEPKYKLKANLQLLFDDGFIAQPIIKKEHLLLMKFAEWLDSFEYKRNNEGKWSAMDLPFTYTTEELVLEFKKEISDGKIRIN